MIIINKRNLFFLISVWLLSTLLSAQNVTISTPHTQLLLSVPNGGTPEQLYYGSRTSDADIRSICETARRRNASDMEWGIHAKRHCLSAMPTAT